MQMTSGEERVMKSAGRIKCAFNLSPQIDMEISKKSSDKEKKVGFIQISPTREGPWTTVKLNYAAPAACWRLGNNVVASEVSIMENNRYVNIRSLVSVRNDTEFTMHLRLKLRTSDETITPDNERKEENDNGYEFVPCELFETQKYTPTAGWVGLDFNEASWFLDLQYTLFLSLHLAITILEYKIVFKLVKYANNVFCYREFC